MLAHLLSGGQLATLALTALLAGVTSLRADGITFDSSDGWMPFAEGIAKLGISASYSDKILRAGFMFGCPDQPDEKGKIVLGTRLNAWLVGTESDAVYTNAHAVVDEHGKSWLSYEECRIASFIRIASDRPQYFHIDPRWDHFGLGVLKLKTGQYPKDRARIPLPAPIAGSRPLANDPKRVASIVQKGDEVIVVSWRPEGALPNMPDDVAVMIQACHARKIIPSKGSNPGLLNTDCNSEPGTSGSLFFVRDAEIPGDLVPVAMLSGSMVTPGSTNWSDRNTAISILLDEFFFSTWAQSGEEGTTIAPATAWQPLVGGATRLGISGEYIEKILRAGFSFECDGVVLNGWLLGAETDAIYTNAHAVIDSPNFPKEPFEECAVMSFVPLAGHTAPSRWLDIDPDWRHFRLGTLKVGETAEISKDRAQIPFGDDRPDNRSNPLATDPSNVASIVSAGDDVFLVSHLPPERLAHLRADVGLIVQRCRVQKVIRSQKGNPGLIQTDCASQAGTSGALYFVKDKDRAGDLVPVAMASSLNQNPGFSVGILLDEHFFSSWAQ